MYMCVPVSIYVYIYPIPSGRRSDGFVSQKIQTSTGGDRHNHQLNTYLYVCMCMYM